MLAVSFFCYCTYTDQKLSITASLKIYNFPHIGENIIIISRKTCYVLIFEKIHITQSYFITFLVNIWNHGKNLKDLRSQNVGLVSYLAI